MTNERLDGSGTVCRRCKLPHDHEDHTRTKSILYHAFEAEPAPAEQPRLSHNHSAGSDYCPACTAPVAASPAEGPRQELSKAEARQLAAGLIDYAEGRVKSFEEIELEIEGCGELPRGAETAGDAASLASSVTTHPLSNEHPSILQFSMPKRLMAEMRRAIASGNVSEITRIYYEMWPEEKPAAQPSPDAAKVGEIVDALEDLLTNYVEDSDNGTMYWTPEGREKATAILRRYFPQVSASPSDKQIETWIAKLTEGLSSVAAGLIGARLWILSMEMWPDAPSTPSPAPGNFVQPLVDGNPTCHVCGTMMAHDVESCGCENDAIYCPNNKKGPWMCMSCGTSTLPKAGLAGEATEGTECQCGANMRQCWSSVNPVGTYLYCDKCGAKTEPSLPAPAAPEGAAPRIAQLERWLNDAASVFGNCDLDSVAKEAERAVAEVRELRASLTNRDKTVVDMRHEIITAKTQRDEYLETAQRIQGDFERAKTAHDTCEAQLTKAREAVLKAKCELIDWQDAVEQKADSVVEYYQDFIKSFDALRAALAPDTKEQS